MWGTPSWMQAQDDCLRAGWRNPKVSRLDLADVLMVTFAAVQTRARNLGLGKKAESTPIPPSILAVDNGTVSFDLVGAGGKKIALLDESDADWFLNHPGSWLAHQEEHLCYVWENGHRPQRKAHRLLMLAKPGQIVDHINGNGLDIRRGNLRFVTTTQNCHNSRRRKHSRSLYKGVWLHRLTGLYGGAIKGPDGHRHSIGYYKTEEEAARAHDAVAFILRGEFAYLNMPDRLMTDDEMLMHKSIARLYNDRRGQRAEEAADAAL